jgi:hypothetical protein
MESTPGHCFRGLASDLSARRWEMWTAAVGRNGAEIYVQCYDEGACEKEICAGTGDEWRAGGGGPRQIGHEGRKGACFVCVYFYLLHAVQSIVP